MIPRRIVRGQCSGRDSAFATLRKKENRTISRRNNPADSEARRGRNAILQPIARSVEVDFGIASGVVVDTHVHRVSRRLDLTKKDNPVDIEQDLMKIIPKERWILFSHQVIHHGRNLCIARKPRCSECLLDPICYAKDKTI